MLNKKLLLIILDGWGIGDHQKDDVVFKDSPKIKALMGKYPHSTLQASGESVGLPKGQMGNSEAGHLNLGAGRVVYQDLVRINKAIKDGSFARNQEILKAFAYARKNKKNVHFTGLISDGGVHSELDHLYKLCDLAKKSGIKDFFVHAITDGRDTDPFSGIKYLANLQKYLEKTGGRIASVIGRYYAMDRDKRWERIEKGYKLFISGIGKKTNNLNQAIKDSYKNNITDEFIEPLVIVDQKNNPIGNIQKGDVVICFNFRTDRLREMIIALSQRDFPKYEMKKISLYLLTMTSYDQSFKNIRVIFNHQDIKKTLGEVISENKLKQLRLAETEKYPHVTFFFSGGREKAFLGEDRILIHSPKVATYDLKPEMSALKIKNKVGRELKKNKYNFICLNFANGDMVGHTGKYKTIEKAVKIIDLCVAEVVAIAEKNSYEVLIVSDHGNAEHKINKDGTPNTAHSTNPVPCILISNNYHKIKNGVLADIAPTILKIIGLKIPKEMTGKVLVD